MAYGQNNIDQYRKNAVVTASPLQLVIMLYDGCLKFMDQAKLAMEQKRHYDQNQNFQRAQNIVTELTSTLDTKQGGEIAQNLAALYNYVYDRLVAANINDDLEALDQATQVMIELRSSWAAIEAAQKPTVQPEALRVA